MSSKTKALDNVVTGDWRENLKKLTVGQSFLFPVAKRESVAPEVSKQKKLHGKIYTTTEAGQPKGFVRVTRLEDEKELQEVA